MVVASTLGLSLSFVPCLLIGLIMLISFLLCNCEYIGQTVASYFCAWKNKRKKPLKPENNGKSNKSLKGGETSTKSDGKSSDELFSSSSSDQEYSVTLRKNIPGNGNDLMDSADFDAGEVASAPSLSPAHSVSDLIDFNDDTNAVNLPQADGSDPPPSYDECLKDKYRRD